MDNYHVHQISIMLFLNFFHGIIYSEGYYVPQDIQKSIHYYTLAAKNNDPDSLNNLGNIYIHKLSPPNAI